MSGIFTRGGKMIWTPEHVDRYLARYAGKVTPPSWAATESKFQSHVIQLAYNLGWTFFHATDMIRSEAGFPDLAMVRGHRFILAELKTEKGKLSREQERWQEMLRLTPVENYVFRPSMIEEIIRILR